MATRNSIAVVGVIALAIAGATVGAGGAIAAGALFSPAGVTTDEGVNPESMPDPQYPVNDSGQTYGSLLDSNAPKNDPDLILVEATNGKVGYVHADELHALDGTTAAESFKSPEEAIAWSDAHANDYNEIPVYEADGTTPVGIFALGQKQ